MPQSVHVSQPVSWHNTRVQHTHVTAPRALSLAGDDELPDIWYNIGQLALGIGDLGLAFQRQGARRGLAVT